MGEEERTAIAEAIVEIDRAIVHLSPGEQERLIRRRLALVAVLRTDAVVHWNRSTAYLES